VANKQTACFLTWLRAGLKLAGRTSAQCPAKTLQGAPERNCKCQCSNSDSLKSSQLASRILPGPILIEMSYADVIKKFQSWYGRANNAEASFKQIGILHWDICGANFCGAPLQGMVQGFNPQALAAPQDAPRKEARHDLNETKQHTQTNTPSGRGQSHAITHWQC